MDGIWPPLHFCYEWPSARAEFMDGLTVATALSYGTRGGVSVCTHCQGHCARDEALDQWWCVEQTASL